MPPYFHVNGTFSSPMKWPRLWRLLLYYHIAYCNTSTCHAPHGHSAMDGRISYDGPCRIVSAVECYIDRAIKNEVFAKGLVPPLENCTVYAGIVCILDSGVV